jgi:regulatory protein
VAAALSIKARALRYLAMREHSRAELARKLARHVEDTPDDPAEARIQRALDELAARGLLDEQRAADALVTAQAARFGALKLRQSLRTRGVGAEEAASALAAVEGTELERARTVWRRRFGAGTGAATTTGAAPISTADRARQARFLAGRGFSGDVIRRVVRDLDDDDPDSSHDT